MPETHLVFFLHHHHDFLLKDLVSLCEMGYGEIELHIHHGTNTPDTADNLRRTILRSIEEFSPFGIFGMENGAKRYAFIHGRWALANSYHGRYCGVNNEIKVLHDTGCYADATFPSPQIESNPAQPNQLYYARQVPDRPKSYNKGIPVKVSGQEQGDLMMIQGPTFPFIRTNKPWSFRVYGDGTTHADFTRLTSEKIVDRWVHTGICVRGKPEWIVIKTHMHGATEYADVLGKQMDEILDYLESKYNDGDNYILHYVTVREVYNIIKAAEAGEPNPNPNQYRNYLIQAPSYNSKPDIPEASAELKRLLAKTIPLRGMQPWE